MSTIKLTQGQIKEIHYRFLTDPELQKYNASIVAVEMTMIPSYIVLESGILEKRYNPEDSRLILKMRKVIDNYIELFYPELVKADEFCNSKVISHNGPIDL